MSSMNSHKVPLAAGEVIWIFLYPYCDSSSCYYQLMAGWWDWHYQLAAASHVYAFKFNQETRVIQQLQWWATCVEVLAGHRQMSPFIVVRLTPAFKWYSGEFLSHSPSYVIVLRAGQYLSIVCFFVITLGPIGKTQGSSSFLFHFVIFLDFAFC